MDIRTRKGGCPLVASLVISKLYRSLLMSLSPPRREREQPGSPRFRFMRTGRREGCAQGGRRLRKRRDPRRPDGRRGGERKRGCRRSGGRAGSGVSDARAALAAAKDAAAGFRRPRSRFTQSGRRSDSARLGFISGIVSRNSHLQPAVEGRRPFASGSPALQAVVENPSLPVCWRRRVCRSDIYV